MTFELVCKYDSWALSGIDDYWKVLPPKLCSPAYLSSGSRGSLSDVFLERRFLRDLLIWELYQTLLLQGLSSVSFATCILWAMKYIDFSIGVLQVCYCKVWGAPSSLWWNSIQMASMLVASVSPHLFMFKQICWFSFDAWAGIKDDTSH